MPIIKHNGVTSIILGNGDVGLAHIRDLNNPIHFLAFSQMNKQLEVGGDTTPEDVFANQPETVLGFYNTKGVDNIIELLQKIRAQIEEHYEALEKQPEASQT